MIVIVGGGMVGLVLAAALARVKIPVTIIENQIPSLQWQPENLDARVSAINNASQNILMNLGVWSKILPASQSPLRGLQVWDHVGGGQIEFDSADIGKAQLGFIVENRAIVKALWEHLSSEPLVKILCPAKPMKIVRESDILQLQLEDQTLISAQLIIGADGAQSWVREQMGVMLMERPYQQQAIVAVIDIEKPHQMLAYQSFLPSGPLGVLPLAHPNQCAMVWSNDLPDAQRLLSLSQADFNRELSLALSYRLGKMTCLSDLKTIPLIMRHAKDYVQPRLALIGDAAHSIHPLAGQGANLGFLDAAVLAQVIAEAQAKNQDIGGLRVLKRYQRWRKGDNLLMLAAMRGFKELFGLNSSWIVQLRSQGLNITDHTHWLKHVFMRHAMGQQGDLPELAMLGSGFPPHY